MKNKKLKKKIKLLESFINNLDINQVSAQQHCLNSLALQAKEIEKIAIKCANIQQEYARLNTRLFPEATIRNGNRVVHPFNMPKVV